MTRHECILACYALASSGHLEEAKENLRRNEPCLKCEEGIDLLARIELALGNENEARRLWEDAVSSGIGGERSRKVLAALELTSWRYRRAVRTLRIALAIAVPAVAGLAIGLSLRSGSTPDGIESESQTLSEVECLSKAVETNSVSEVVAEALTTNAASEAVETAALTNSLPITE